MGYRGLLQMSKRQRVKQVSKNVIPYMKEIKAHIAYAALQARHSAELAAGAGKLV